MLLGLIVHFKKCKKIDQKRRIDYQNACACKKYKTKKRKENFDHIG